jgi:hypothetical protein
MSQAMPPPPMSPMPYANSGMEPTRTSAAAVISLICGVLGCFIVTGIVAIITGIVGLRATRNPQVKGRGMAIAGIALGVVFGLGGGGCLLAGGAGLWFANSEANRSIVVIDGLTKAAAADDADGAMKFVDPTIISKAQVEDFIARVKPLGQPGSYEKSGFNANKNYGNKLTIDLNGAVPYPSGKKDLGFTVQQQPDGTYKVVGVRW